MQGKLGPFPDFASEAEECNFWQIQGSLDYLDLSQAQLVTFTNLKLAKQ